EEEHPIEIELPFLQRVCPQCRIVPILMGTDSEEAVQALTKALLAVLPGQRAVIIASSDLSHYPTYEDALTIDGSTLAAIETGDTLIVRETIADLMASNVANLYTCACGEAPILVAMQAAQGLGANTITLLQYANSGDSPFGNKDQVVGYGAVMFWHYEPLALSSEQQEELLTLARTTIETYLKNKSMLPFETDDPLLIRRSGVFVTIKIDDELRGCIGHIWSDLPLYQAVQETAISAATQDAHFAPLTQEELEKATLEISILSPFYRVKDVETIQVGTHGLMIIKNLHQGLLLPQVPVEQGWDRETFLENLCLKAGLEQGCWEDAALYAFTVVVFGEQYPPNNP
ncbi:MAG: AmmeMemoRadiSam system protein A, partial [Chloroflexota bacterium]